MQTLLINYLYLPNSREIFKLLLKEEMIMPIFFLQ